MFSEKQCLHILCVDIGNPMYLLELCGVKEIILCLWIHFVFSGHPSILTKYSFMWTIWTIGLPHESLFSQQEINQINANTFSFQ